MNKQLATIGLLLIAVGVIVYLVQKYRDTHAPITAANLDVYINNSGGRYINQFPEFQQHTLNEVPANFYQPHLAFSSPHSSNYGGPHIVPLQKVIAS